jgi:hypothetical protein
MIQEVKFTGLSHSPSDYEAQDGELGTCLNLINEDGALKPIPKPQAAESFTLPEGASIKLVHKVTHDSNIHSHYIICLADGSWCWTEKGGDGSLINFDLGDFKVNAVSAVGNILCFVGASKIIYAYWQDSSYRLMDLTSIKYSGIGERTTLDKTYDVIEPTDYYPLTDKDNESIWFRDIDATKAQNLFVAKDADLNKKMDDESFKYMQFGVLALRLYDGSHILVGNPFTITDGSGIDNTVNLYYAESAGKLTGDKGTFNFSKSTCYAINCAQSLFKYKIKISFDELSQYEDIIDGIDIYVSNSIYPYKTNVQLDDVQSKVYFNGIYSKTYNTEEYGSIDIKTVYLSAIKGGNCFSCFGHWSYPAMTKDELNEEISKLVFYKSTSFSYEDIINGKEKYLKKITQAEESISLADSQRASYGAKVAITYNNRLHLANTVTSSNSSINGNVTTQSLKATIITHVKYKYNGQTVESYDVNEVGYPLEPFLGFPSDYVTFFEVYMHQEYSSFYYRFEPQIYNKSDIGYSYYISYNSGKLSSIETKDFTETITQAKFNEVLATAKSFEGTTVNSSSLIKVSEAENPLVFPAKNSVQVGSSIISAIAANTRPISEGQFGEAPLYAFTDEGVWVLMTSETGTYEARQPAQRDICSNPDSILQIDDAVLFPTERGIMMQEGRKTTCITDVLDDYPFDYTQLYKEEHAKQVLATSNISENAVKYVRFREYLQSADMIYDYYGNRIIVFNPSYEYAYVYSLKSHLWGTMESTFSKRVNIYPDSYAINKDNQVVNVYTQEPTADVPYFLCSRPLGLSSPEVHKTIFSCITRGYFRDADKGKCGMVLYGSNDLFHWFVIKSSVHKYLRGMAGSPYKYFRIALIGSLSPDESLSGISADFQERWQNKLR